MDVELAVGVILTSIGSSEPLVIIVVAVTVDPDCVMVMSTPVMMVGGIVVGGGEQTVAPQI